MIITKTYDFIPKEYITSSIGESWWNDIATPIKIDYIIAVDPAYPGEDRSGE
jgi:hypothetical protein